MNNKKLLQISLPIISSLIMMFILLFAFKVIGVIPFIICINLFVGLLILNILLLVKLIKRKKQKNTKTQSIESVDGYLIDVYKILGIPIQYNKDGTIKDVFELLGIEPVFDEEGNRDLTIYELLGILPRFNQEAKEIPSVLVIKNRVNRIAKVDLSSRVLTRKLTDAEKEMIVIKETLKKKLDEAQKTKDKQKETAIKKALTQSKPKGKEEKSTSSKIKYAMNFGKDKVGNGSVAKSKLIKNDVNIFDIFSIGNSKKKKEDKPKKVEPVKAPDKQKEKEVKPKQEDELFTINSFMTNDEQERGR